MFQFLVNQFSHIYAKKFNFNSYIVSTFFQSIKKNKNSNSNYTNMCIKYFKILIFFQLIDWSECNDENGGKKKEGG